MNLIQKNRIISKQAEEDIEIVEGELIAPYEETGIEKKRTSDIKARRPVELVSVIASAALGLFKLYKIFSGIKTGDRPVKMRRRRRRR